MLRATRIGAGCAGAAILVFVSGCSTFGIGNSEIDSKTFDPASFCATFEYSRSDLLDRLHQDIKDQVATVPKMDEPTEKGSDPECESPLLTSFVDSLGLRTGASDVQEAWNKAAAGFSKNLESGLEEGTKVWDGIVRAAPAIDVPNVKASLPSCQAAVLNARGISAALIKLKDAAAAYVAHAKTTNKKTSGKLADWSQKFQDLRKDCAGDKRSCASLLVKAINELRAEKFTFDDKGLVPAVLANAKAIHQHRLQISSLIGRCESEIAVVERAIKAQIVKASNRFWIDAKERSQNIEAQIGALDGNITKARTEFEKATTAFDSLERKVLEIEWPVTPGAITSILLSERLAEAVLSAVERSLQGAEARLSKLDEKLYGVIGLVQQIGDEQIQDLFDQLFENIKDAIANVRRGDAGGNDLTRTELRTALKDHFALSLGVSACRRLMAAAPAQSTLYLTPYVHRGLISAANSYLTDLGIRETVARDFELVQKLFTCKVRPIDKKYEAERVAAAAELGRDLENLCNIFNQVTKDPVRCVISQREGSAIIHVLPESAICANPNQTSSDPKAVSWCSTQLWRAMDQVGAILRQTGLVADVKLTLFEEGKRGGLDVLAADPAPLPPDGKEVEKKKIFDADKEKWTKMDVCLAPKAELTTDDKPEVIEKAKCLSDLCRKRNQKDGKPASLRVLLEKVKAEEFATTVWSLGLRTGGRMPQDKLCEVLKFENIFATRGFNSTVLDEVAYVPSVNQDATSQRKEYRVEYRLRPRSTNATAASK